jgi:broad specificity phosphatase PhoE
MKIFFIRHGQTDYNVHNRVQGSSDIPLNNKGIHQAKTIKINLENCANGLHSGLSRSKTTLDIILHNNDEHNKDKHISIGENILLKERLYGIFEGLTHDEIFKQYHALNIDIPGAESVEDVQKRAKSFLRYAYHNYSGVVTVVTHSGFMHALYKLLFSINPNHFTGINIENCSIFDITYDIVNTKLIFSFKFENIIHKGDINL